MPGLGATRRELYDHWLDTGSRMRTLPRAQTQLCCTTSAACCTGLWRRSAAVKVWRKRSKHAARMLAQFGENARQDSVMNLCFFSLRDSQRSLPIFCCCALKTAKPSHRAAWSQVRPDAVIICRRLKRKCLDFQNSRTRVPGGYRHYRYFCMNFRVEYIRNRRVGEGQLAHTTMIVNMWRSRLPLGAAAGKLR